MKYLLCGLLLLVCVASGIALLSCKLVIARAVIFSGAGFWLAITVVAYLCSDFRFGFNQPTK